MKQDSYPDIWDDLKKNAVWECMYQARNSIAWVYLKIICIIGFVDHLEGNIAGREDDVHRVGLGLD